MAKLRSSGAKLGPSGPQEGPTWGPSGSPEGPSWARKVSCGPCWGQLGAKGTPREVNLDAKGGQVGSNEGLRKGKGDPKAMKEDMLVVQRRPKWDPRVFGGAHGDQLGPEWKAHLGLMGG